MGTIRFLDRYGSEQQCREALAKARWPQGWRCQGCGHPGHCHLQGRDVYQCNRCKRQVSLTSGTLFAGTKLPPRTWFLAIYLLTQHKNGISALALRRQLGVSYNTAWLLKYKLMQAMVVHHRGGKHRIAHKRAPGRACLSAHRSARTRRSPASARLSSAISFIARWRLVGNPHRKT